MTVTVKIRKDCIARNLIVPKKLPDGVRINLDGQFELDEDAILELPVDQARTLIHEGFASPAGHQFGPAMRQHWGKK
jgi:hypothetical protein